MDSLIVADQFHCDNYCIFIAARHFNSIDDFINLQMVIKRFRGTLEKFHYNPITLTNKTLPFFPNVQTYHLYFKHDAFLKPQRLCKYVVWYRVDYNEIFNKR